MEIFIGMVIFVLGLCAGSFVNMLIYRTAVRYKLVKSFPGGISQSSIKFKSLNKNRSVCDFCGKQLSWFDNIPVISWLWLKGKSRCCGKSLPTAYPITELTTGLLFLIFFKLSAVNIELILGLVVITLLVFLASFDMKYMILPDFSEYILIGVAAVSLVFRENRWQYLAVGLVMFVLFWLLSKLRIKGKQAMGTGDTPLAAFIGLWLGWPLAVVAFYIAFITGAIVGGGMILIKLKKRDGQIAFGPFLILGTLMAWWSGEVIIKLIIH